jgi:formylglycine-generating enzyme required for sulfatase activity
MKHTKCNLKLSVAILFLILSFSVKLPGVNAQNNPNTITFDNQSGQHAIVKLIGPTGQTVEVSSGQSRTVNAAAGKYYILTRYGSKPKAYKYAKGDPFTVTQTVTQYSAITITLHKVIGGSYPTHPISGQEFNKTTVSTQRIEVPNLKNNTTKQKSTIAKDESEMILVPAGQYYTDFLEGVSRLKDGSPIKCNFRMLSGCDGSILKPFWGGEGSLRIPRAFYINKYEVTNSEYKSFINDTGHTPPPHWHGRNYPEGKADFPVLVEWTDAQAYCKWVGKRLPSFDQWVAATNDVSLKHSPWMGRLDGSEATKYRMMNIPDYKPVDFVREVGRSLSDKSPFGVYDLIGNALEWTSTSATVEAATYIRLGGYCVVDLGEWLPRVPLRQGDR